jgi:hypothetical protein
MRMQRASYGKLSVQLYPVACEVVFLVLILSRRAVSNVPLLVRLLSTARYVLPQIFSVECLIWRQELQAETQQGQGS